MTSDDDERWVDAESGEEDSEVQIDQRELERQQKVQEVISKYLNEPDQIDAIAKIRGWFRPDEDSSYYPLVQEYLNGKSNLKETMEKITGPIDEKIWANKLDEVPWIDLWYCIIHSAKRILFSAPKAHQDLIELMKAIKNHKEPTDAQSGVYSSLTNFGMSARETMNDSPGYGAGFSVPEIHAYANLQYFFALLTRGDIYNFWLYVIWAMRDALEDELTNGGPNDAHVPATAIQKYDAYVPAAAMWVSTLGEALYEHEEDFTPTSPNQGNPAGGGKFWKGKAELSKARWALWKKRFQKVTMLEGIRDETRELAKEAFEHMDSIDGHATS